MSEEKEHALLSASSSHKWLVCTPSARLEERFENKTSEYMEEGTLAHEIAEFKLRNYFFDGMTKRKYNSQMKKFEQREHYNPEIQGYTDDYLDYVKGLALQTAVKPFVAIEQTIDYSVYAPEGFGTADFLMIAGNTLHIVDFKYGKGVPVSAENNPQMKLYALGALAQFGIIYSISRVKMTIFQPRLDNISEFEMPAGELQMWGNTVVKAQAEKAFKGEGDYVQGEHCRFCRAKGTCRFRSEANLKTYEETKSTPILSNKELGEVLLKIEGLDSWLKDLKTEALNQLLQGNDVEGWKAVEGKSNRTITDVDKAFEILKENGIDEALLYERKPLGLTALEKLVSKKKFNELVGNYIEKPKGAPTLAKATDKREIYKRSSAEEDFGKVEN